MGHFVFFLLGLFAIGCVLYGISAGVQLIQRGFSGLACGGRKQGMPTPPISPPSQHGIHELRELFALHQQGALTQEEFQSMKRHLLATTQSAPHVR